MPVLDASEYQPPHIFKNGNINTIFPFLFRKNSSPEFKRVRFETKDHDFIDLDTITSEKEKLAIICHGLEGSSESQYMLNMSHVLAENGWDVVCINFRSCSGELNRKLVMYHSGFTSDLHEVVEKYKTSYDHISLIGFSLGGNVVLKYLGDDVFALPKQIRSAVAMSVPVDLSKSAVKISSRSNWVYDKRFRVSLEKKIRDKHKLFPKEVDLSKLKKIKTIRDFDEYYTGPIHGFDGAEDYYAKCSSKQFLPNISIPSLLITAIDDPFLPEESYPYAMAIDNDNFYFLAPKFGGHVGFTTFGSDMYWNEHKTLQFITDPDVFGDTHKHIVDQLH